MPNYPKDIEAEVTFLTRKEGGRKGPIFSGYRPQFFYDGHDWDSVLWCESEGFLIKGKPVRIFFCFTSPKYHIGKLFPGKEFQLREGLTVIANGRVLRLLDLELSANQAKHE